MRLVELMNSSLYILSEVGLGTDVYFTVDVIAPKGKHNKRRSRRQEMPLEAISMTPLHASSKRAAP